MLRRILSWISTCHYRHRMTRAVFLNVLRVSLIYALPITGYCERYPGIPYPHEVFAISYDWDNRGWNCSSGGAGSIGSAIAESRADLISCTQRQYPYPNFQVLSDSVSGPAFFSQRNYEVRVGCCNVCPHSVWVEWYNVSIKYSYDLQGQHNISEAIGSARKYIDVIHVTRAEAPFCFSGQEQYSIKLSPLNSPQESGAILKSVEPSKTATLVARVYDQNGQLVNNAMVKLEADAVSKSGGHQHHDSNRPKGHLGGSQPTPHIISGNTGSGGGFTFTFTAPAPAGDHKIKASCTDITCTQQGPDAVWVGIKELISLPTINSYALLPNRDRNHPDNHYMVYGASIKLMQLADLYRRRFPGDPLLHVNDASLERGGLFDIDSNWSYQPRGHKAHRRGEAVDIRANPDIYPEEAIPVRNFEKFEETALEVGGNAKIHSPGGSNQHYHVEF